MAGAGAVVDSLTPRTMPLWPAYGHEATALPALAAALDGLRVLPICGVALFTLAWLGGITAGFTRWRLVAVAVLALAFAGAALVSGESAADAAMGGAVDGVLAALLVYALLRYDARAVPAFLAAGAVLQAVAGAAQKSGSSAWLHAALTAAVAIAAAWLATRYLERSGAGRAPGPAQPQRTLTQ